MRKESERERKTRHTHAYVVYVRYWHTTTMRQGEQCCSERTTTMRQDEQCCSEHTTTMRHDELCCSEHTAMASRYSCVLSEYIYIYIIIQRCGAGQHCSTDGRIHCLDTQAKRSLSGTDQTYPGTTGKQTAGKHRCQIE